MNSLVVASSNRVTRTRQLWKWCHRTTIQWRWIFLIALFGITEPIINSSRSVLVVLVVVDGDASSSSSRWLDGVSHLSADSCLSVWDRDRSRHSSIVTGGIITGDRRRDDVVDEPPSIFNICSKCPDRTQSVYPVVERFVEANVQVQVIMFSWNYLQFGKGCYFRNFCPQW